MLLAQSLNRDNADNQTASIKLLETFIRRVNHLIDSGTLTQE